MFGPLILMWLSPSPPQTKRRLSTVAPQNSSIILLSSMSVKNFVRALAMVTHDPEDGACLNM